MKFNIYDMLVFEDESGSIYQDYIRAINRRSYSGLHFIDCNNFTIFINKETDNVEKIYNTTEGMKIDGWKLKEIWARTDEDTYKKVWESK